MKRLFMILGFLAGISVFTQNCDKENFSALSKNNTAEQNDLTNDNWEDWENSTFEITEGPQAPGSMGNLNTFYRSMQIQATYMLQTNGEAGFLISIPDYLTSSDLDYPYQFFGKKRSHIPYVSRFSVVRFLGGHAPHHLNSAISTEPQNKDSLDLIYRKNSQMLYRMELVGERLNPYLDAGYREKDITLNFSNMPWALTANNPGGFFGNNRPPRSLGEWEFLSRKVAQELKNLYGPKANDFRIKGIEEFNGGEIWVGTPRQYAEYYDRMIKGVRQVLPGVEILPGEFSGIGGPKYEEVVHHLGNSNNIFTQTHHKLSDFKTISRSSHSSAIHQNHVRGIASAVDIWKNSLYKYREVSGRATTFEMPQFGLLGHGSPNTNISQEEMAKKPDLGARAVSWQFQALFRAKQSIKGLRRISHWNTFMPIGEGQTLPRPLAWLYQILDNLQGQPMYHIPTITSHNSLNIEYFAMAFYDDKRTTVILSRYDSNYSSQSRARMAKFKIPKVLIPQNYQLLQTEMKSSNSIGQVIKRDLAAHNLLLPKYHNANPTLITSYTAMAKNKNLARQLVLERKGFYERMFAKKLKLGPAKMTNITNDGNNYRNIEVALEPYQVKVLVFDRD